MKPDEFLDQIVSSDVAAALICGTPHWLRKLHHEFRAFAPVSRGRWRVGDVLAGHFRYLTEANERRTKSAADSRVRDARAAEIERRMAIQGRDLIELAEALATVDDITGAFLGAVSGLPAQIAKDQRERQRITEICDGVRSRLDGRFSKSRDALRTGRAADQAEDEDDTG